MDIIVLVLFAIFGFSCDAQSQEQCVFQMDSKTNKIKITCGSGAVLNIIDQHGNTLLSAETNANAETPVIFQLNRSSIASLNGETTKAIKKLADASKLLRKIREELTLQVNNLINLTSLLQQGDSELKKDLDTLRRHELTSPLMREAIIAALQNQYNFLRMGLLTQNTQLNELIRTTMRLTTSVMKTTRGARSVGELLDLRTDAMNETLFNITKLMPGGFEYGAFFGEKSVLCPQELRSISDRGSSVVTGVEQGVILRDPYTPEKIWVMYGFSNINEVAEYNSLKALKIELVDKLYELPFSCVGTGHAVYKRVLYCQKMFTNKIIKYSLAESRWLGEKQLDHVGVHNVFPYESGKYTDIDFAVDENGLWVIYATNASRGNIVLSRMNEDELSFQKTWVTDVLKTNSGNAFIICGVLYVTNSFDDIPTFVKYKFDTNTNEGTELNSTVIPFVNSVDKTFARVYSLVYSPSDVTLYSWNNGRIEIYPVYFSGANEP